MTSKPYISLFASALLSSCVTQSPAPIDFKSTQPSFSQAYSEKTVISTEESPSRISTRELKHHNNDDKRDGVMHLKARDHSSSQQQDEKPITRNHEDDKPKSQPVISTKSIEEELEELENQQEDTKKDTTKPLTKKTEPIKQEESKETAPTNESEMIVKPEQIKTEHIEDTTHSTNISLSMPVHGKIVTKFGDMVDGKKVNGIDFAAPRGADVAASTSGIVVFAGNDPKFGNLVIIKSNNSDTFVAYAHMEDMLVSNNEEIAQGQVIGHVGSSGDTTTAKLHFALRVGKKPVDPTKYLK